MTKKKRDSLIEANMDLARLVARSVAAASTHSGAPIAELEGDAFYLLVVAAEKYKPSRGLAFRQWALWFISRRLRETLRGKNLKDGVHNQLPHDYDAETLDNSPEDSAALTELRRQVIEAVNELEPRARRVIRLRYQKGLSYPEVGAVIKRSASTVGEVHRLAIGELKRKLDHLQQHAAALTKA